MNVYLKFLIRNFFTNKLAPDVPELFVRRKLELIIGNFRYLCELNRYLLRKIKSNHEPIVGIIIVFLEFLNQTHILDSYFFSLVFVFIDVQRDFKLTYMIRSERCKNVLNITHCFIKGCDDIAYLVVLEGYIELDDGK
jgi:hypothetical protein